MIHHPLLSKLKWHARILLVFLILHGAWSSIGLLLFLARNPGRLPFDLFLSALAVPVLIILAAYLLLKKSKWLLAVFALLPIAFVAVVWNVRPYPPVGMRFDWYYFSSFPVSIKIAIGLYLLCLVYSVFLKKWGELK